MSLLVNLQVNATTGAPDSISQAAFEEGSGEPTPYDYIKDQNKIFTETDSVIVSVLLAALSCFGIVANTITFIVILRLPRTVFTVLLASLCISDFLSAIDSPFVLYRSTYGYRYYDLSEAVCKLAQAIDFWTTTVTIQHILLFSILRFVSVKSPHKFKRFTAKQALRAVCFIWIETLLVGFICFVLWPGVSPPPPFALAKRSCRMKRRWIKMAMVYSLYVFPFLLYLPMFLVILVSLALTFLISSRKWSQKGETTSINRRARSDAMKKRENYALLQLTLIIASFLFGYIPDISYRAAAIIGKSRGQPLAQRTEWVFSVTAHCFLRISECLNPVFYNLGSSTMREGTRRLLFGEKNTNKNSSKASQSTKTSENVSTPNIATTRF